VKGELGMKITVIGYWGAFPKQNEATTGYLVQTENHNILVDCGSGVLSKVQNYIDLSKIDAVILSHYHADHISDIFCFQYEAALALKLGMRDKQLEIYAHDLDSKFSELNYKDGAIGKKIDENTVITFDNLNISFKWMKHAAPCLAMRFEEQGKILAYSADTEWCNQIVSIADKADLFICETSLFSKQKGQINGHLTAGEVGKIANIAKVKKLVLTHFPHYGNTDDLVKEAAEEFKGEIYKAETGAIFEL
jgi:ribonuclease BN (tRNA processing enzyme)